MGQKERTREYSKLKEGTKRRTKVNLPVGEKERTREYSKFKEGKKEVKESLPVREAERRYKY